MLAVQINDGMGRAGDGCLQRTPGRHVAGLAGCALVPGTGGLHSESSFVLAVTGSLFLIASNPHGGEHIKELLSGRILWMGWGQLIPVGLLYALLLALWFRSPRLRSSFGFYIGLRAGDHRFGTAGGSLSGFRQPDRTGAVDAGPQRQGVAWIGLADWGCRLCPGAHAFCTCRPVLPNQQGSILELDIRRHYGFWLTDGYFIIDLYTPTTYHSATRVNGLCGCGFSHLRRRRHVGVIIV